MSTPERTNLREQAIIATNLVTALEDALRYAANLSPDFLHSGNIHQVTACISNALPIASLLKGKADALRAACDFTAKDGRYL